MNFLNLVLLPEVPPPFPFIESLLIVSSLLMNVPFYCATLTILSRFSRKKDEEQFLKVYDDVERKYVRGGEKSLKTEWEILSKIKKVNTQDSAHFL